MFWRTHRGIVDWLGPYFWCAGNVVIGDCWFVREFVASPSFIIWSCYSFLRMMQSVDPLGQVFWSHGTSWSWVRRSAAVRTIGVAWRWCKDHLFWIFVEVCTSFVVIWLVWSPCCLPSSSLQIVLWGFRMLRVGLIGLMVRENSDLGIAFGIVFSPFCADSLPSYLLSLLDHLSWYNFFSFIGWGDMVHNYDN